MAIKTQPEWDLEAKFIVETASKFKAGYVVPVFHSDIDGFKRYTAMQARSALRDGQTGVVDTFLKILATL